MPREGVFHSRSGKWSVEDILADAQTTKAESTVVEYSRDGKGFGMVRETLERTEIILISTIFTNMNYPC